MAFKKFKDLQPHEQLIHKTLYDNIHKLQAGLIAETCNIVHMGGTLDIDLDYILRKFAAEATRGLIVHTYNEIVKNNPDITIDDAYNEAINIAADHIITVFSDPQCRKEFHASEGAMRAAYDKAMK